MISFKKFLLEGFLIENRAWHGFIKQYGPDILKKAGLHKEYEEIAGEAGHGSPEHLTNFLSDNLGMKDLTPEEGRWIFKNFHRGGIQRAEDIQATAIPSLMDLRKAKANGKSSVDLSSINSLKDLNGHLNKVFPDRALKDFDAKDDEFTVHAENEHWQLVQPKSKNAACAFGRGTGWCTTSTGNTNMFNSYDSTHRGVYILLPKNPQSKNEKYQFSGYPNLIQFMDKNDEPIAAGHKRSEAPNFDERPLPQISNNPQLQSLLDHAKELDAHHELGNMAFQKVTGLNDEDISKILDTPGLHTKISHISSNQFAPEHIDKIVDIVHNHVKNITEQNIDHEPYANMLANVNIYLNQKHIDKLSDTLSSHLEKYPTEKRGNFALNSLIENISQHELFNPFKSDSHMSLFMRSDPSSKEISKAIDKQKNIWDIGEHHIDELVKSIAKKHAREYSYGVDDSAELLTKLSRLPNFSIKSFEPLFDHKMRPSISNRLGQVVIDHVNENDSDYNTSILDETSSDSNSFTKQMVLVHGNINFDHINQGLNDIDPDIRIKAAWRGLQHDVTQGYDMDSNFGDQIRHAEKQREHLAKLVSSTNEDYHLIASQAHDVLNRNHDLTLQLLNNTENSRYGHAIASNILHRSPNQEIYNKARSIYDKFEQNRTRFR